VEYVFPAILEQNNDASYTITFPDLPGCISEGKSLGNSLEMAPKALSQWLEYLLDENENVPEPSDIKSIVTSKKQLTSLVRADIRNNCAIRRTVSIPEWMDKKASSAGISLSKVLQEALK
jgi:predicted RNase H-like HicB family nuclease